MLIYLLCQLNDKIDSINTQYTSLNSRVTVLESEITTLSVIPSGVIVQWHGTISTIPTGYHLCDGNNGTPDLRDKFIVCASQDLGPLPATTIEGAPTGTAGFVVTDTMSTASVATFAGPALSWDANSTGKPTIDGINPLNNYLPPYYALAYIMKL